MGCAAPSLAAFITGCVVGGVVFLAATIVAMQVAFKFVATEEVARRFQDLRVRLSLVQASVV